MNEEIIRALSAELKITEDQVRNTLEMLSQGDTVPFIARYRKEQTKGLDEEQILVIQKQYDYQLKLAERKEDVIRLISEQGKLTDEIKAAVLSCTKLSPTVKRSSRRTRPIWKMPSRPGWPRACRTACV